MLTCTVSMVESAIAIIATCLPALRYMILGTNNNSSKYNSHGKHYELSSSRRRTDGNRLATAHVGSGLNSTRETRHRANGSEDSLFSDGPLGVENATGKITVNTQIETMFEETPSKPSSSIADSKF
jgi:hypothetical protein